MLEPACNFDPRVSLLPPVNNLILPYILSLSLGSRPSHGLSLERFISRRSMNTSQVPPAGQARCEALPM